MGAVIEKIEALENEAAPLRMIEERIGPDQMVFGDAMLLQCLATELDRLYARLIK